MTDDRWSIWAELAATVTEAELREKILTGFKDGKPLPPGGMIYFSPVDPSNHTGARAYLEEDGTFTLSTDAEGDGSLLGKFKVSIKPPPQGRGEDDPKANVNIIDPKYYSFDKSGIEVEVKPGKNEFSITVEKPAKK